MGSYPRSLLGNKTYKAKGEMMVLPKKFLSFTPRDMTGTKKKTKEWSVWTADQDHWLGEVKYFVHWRQYVFFPAQVSLFNPGCLREIADFCELETEEHRQKVK
jgi:hypothetical protein